MPRYRIRYIGARAIRRFLPEPLALRLLSNRYVPVETVYAAARIYADAIVKVGGAQALSVIQGATVLEAGTGIYNPAAAPLLLCGAERLLLLEPFADESFDKHRFCTRFYGLLDLANKDTEFPLPRKPCSLSIPPDCSKLPANISLVSRLWENSKLETASVDLILSTSVLEHLRDPISVLKESARILKPGGWMINTVDMRDHYFKYPFEMLKYSESFWRLLTTSSGGSGYQNRWRVNQWLRTFENSGFQNHVIPILDMKELLALEKPYFHPDFRDFTDDDLSLTRAVIVSHLQQTPQENKESKQGENRQGGGSLGKKTT